MLVVLKQAFCSDAMNIFPTLPHSKAYVLLHYFRQHRFHSIQFFNPTLRYSYKEGYVMASRIFLFYSIGTIHSQYICIPTYQVLLFWIFSHFFDVSYYALLNGVKTKVHNPIMYLRITSAVPLVRIPVSCNLRDILHYVQVHGTWNGIA